MFFDIKTDNSNQTITTGNLSVVYGSSTSSIISNNMIPTKDNVGLSNEAQSIIYIQNNSNLDSEFNLTIGYDYSAYLASADYSAGKTLIPLENIKLAVFEYNTQTSASVRISDIINLGSLPIYDMNENDFHSSTYLVYNSMIERSSSGNSAKTYVIKVWLDEFSPSYSGSGSVYLKLGIESDVTDAKTNYNISGVLKTGSDEVLADADISINNGSKKVTTDATGVYTLSGMREGIYVAKITAADNTVYEGTFVIKEDINNLTINKFVNSHTVSTNDSIPSITYTYGTTINALKNANNIIESSVTYDLVLGSNIILPDVYQIVAGSSVNINNLNIIVNSGKITAINNG